MQYVTDTTNFCKLTIEELIYCLFTPKEEEEGFELQLRLKGQNKEIKWTVIQCLNLLYFHWNHFPTLLHLAMLPCQIWQKYQVSLEKTSLLYVSTWHSHLWDPMCSCDLPFYLPPIWLGNPYKCGKTARQVSGMCL